MTRTTRTRPGVTLIEILVVIAIIGILIALTAAALQKTVEGQNEKASTNHVFKLQNAIDQEYDRVVQKCAKDVDAQALPPQLVSSCNSDLALAKAIWTAFNLRLNFPDQFSEVVSPTNPLTLLDANGNVMCSASQTPPTFASLVGGTAAAPVLVLGDTTRPHDESGVLLYLILARRSVSGGGAMGSAADDLTQASRKKVTFNAGTGNPNAGGGGGGTPKEFEVFADAWKNSIGFNRWKKHFVAGDTEIQSPPHIDPQKVTAVNKDVLDPQDKVRPWNPTNTTPGHRNIVTMKSLLGFGDSTAATPTPAENRVLTVYSTGKTVYTPGTTTPSAAALTPLDDIFGVRLRKQGERGNRQ